MFHYFRNRYRLAQRVYQLEKREQQMLDIVRTLVDGQAALGQSVTDLEARVAALPGGGLGADDTAALQQISADQAALKARVDVIAPAPAPAPEPIV